MNDRKKPGPRPRLTPEEKKIGKMITMSGAEWKKIDETAELLGISRSEYVRRAVANYIEITMME